MKITSSYSNIETQVRSAVRPVVVAEFLPIVMFTALITALALLG